MCPVMVVVGYHNVPECWSKWYPCDLWRYPPVDLTEPYQIYWQVEGNRRLYAVPVTCCLTESCKVKRILPCHVPLFTVLLGILKNSVYSRFLKNDSFLLDMRHFLSPILVRRGQSLQWMLLAWILKGIIWIWRCDVFRLPTPPVFIA